MLQDVPISNTLASARALVAALEALQMVEEPAVKFNKG